MSRHSTDEMDDSSMYGSHAAVNNHSMGNILASCVPYSYNLADSFAPVSHDTSEDMCSILQQIISISSQSLDEAQMRSVVHEHQVSASVSKHCNSHRPHCSQKVCICSGQTLV